MSIIITSIGKPYGGVCSEKKGKFILTLLDIHKKAKRTVISERNWIS